MYPNSFHRYITIVNRGLLENIQVLHELNKLYLIKSPSQIPDASVYHTGHLRIKVLDLGCLGSYILPRGFSLGESSKCGEIYPRLQSSMSYDRHNKCTQVWSTQCIKDALESQVYLMEHNLKKQGNYKGIPIVPRLRYQVNDDNYKSFLSPEEILKGFNNVTVALEFVNVLSIAAMKHRYPKLDLDTIVYRINGGRILSVISDMTGGDEVIAKEFNVTTNTARVLRTDSEISIKHKDILERLINKYNLGARK